MSQLKTNNKKINKGKQIFLSKCEVCDTKKSRSIKEQEANGLGIKTPISKNPLVGALLF